jgi:hypothetical protein
MRLFGGSPRRWRFGGCLRGAQGQEPPASMAPTHGSRGSLPYVWRNCCHGSILTGLGNRPILMRGDSWTKGS